MAYKSVMVPTVLAKYGDQAQYRETMMLLVKEEEDYEQQVMKEEKEEEMKVNWLSGGGQRFVIRSDLDLGVGDGVLLTHPIAMWEGQGQVIEVVEDYEGKKVTVSLSGDARPAMAHTTGFRLGRVYNPAVMKRKMSALMRLTTDPSIPEFLVDMVVRGKVTAIPASGFTFDLDVCRQERSELRLPSLNVPQAHAVSQAVRARFSLIHGPPGTGKTSTTAYIVHLVVGEGQRGLVVAPSNVAADELAKKIQQTGRSVVRVMSRRKQGVARADDQPPTLHLLLGSKPSCEELASLETRLGQLDKTRYKELLSQKEQEILAVADVIVTTVIGAGDSRLADIQFEAVVIDEAGMVTEPQCLVTLARPAKFYLMVGDHKQLGPVVKCEAANQAGLGQSLFLRLVLLGLRPHRLEVQYRMAPEIALLPSKLYYDGFVQDAVKVEERLLPEELSWLKPTMMYHVAGVEKVTGTSFANEEEIVVIEHILDRLLKAQVEPSQIGIITPYSLQKKFLRRYLENSGGCIPATYNAITIGPVEAFQGSEREYIIVSVTRSGSGNLGFLADSRRLTVMLTRARRSLILVGNTTMLAKHVTWGPVLDHYRQLGRLVTGDLQDLEVSHEADGVVAYLSAASGGPRWSIERQLREATANVAKKVRVD